MFPFVAALLVAWMILQTVRRGPRDGMRKGWFMALLLLPAWMGPRVGALTVDLRTVAALTGLFALWFLLPARASRGMHVADVLVLALAAVVVLSEYLTGTAGLFTVPEVARRWLLPYLVGRWFFASLKDIGRVLPLVSKAALVLSLCSLFEAITHENPLHSFVGRRYDVLDQGEGYRWGLKRAQGFLDHPIYLGYLLVLLLPWVLEGRRRAILENGPTWLKRLPYLLAAAILCTASRGPILAALFALAAPSLFRRPELRAKVLRLAAVGVLLLAVFHESVLEALERWSGDGPDAASTLIIGGQEVAYSGTSHRLLLFQAYESALSEFRPFGFGSELRGVEMDEAPGKFYSIDNHYLRFLLQHGYVALGLFVALTLATLVNLGRLALDGASPDAVFAAWLFGVMAAVSVLLFTVWFSPDFGTAWLFSAGLASNLTALRRPATVSRDAESSERSAGEVASRSAPKTPRRG